MRGMIGRCLGKETLHLCIMKRAHRTWLDVKSSVKFIWVKKPTKQNYIYICHFIYEMSRTGIGNTTCIYWTWDFLPLLTFANGPSISMRLWANSGPLCACWSCIILPMEGSLPRIPPFQYSHWVPAAKNKVNKRHNTQIWPCSSITPI